MSDGEWPKSPAVLAAGLFGNQAYFICGLYGSASNPPSDSHSADEGESAN